MPIRFNNVDKTPAGKNQEEASFSAEAVELMKVMSQRESSTGKSVTRPNEVFDALMDMGFDRSDNHDRQTRSEEFLRAVRGFLTAQKRRSPSYNEVLSIMRQLGYSRENATAI